MITPLRVKSGPRYIIAARFPIALFLVAVLIAACAPVNNNTASIDTGSESVTTYPTYRVAVLDLQTSLMSYNYINPLWEKVPDYNAGRVIASRVESALRSMGKFKMLDRAYLNKVLKEKKLSLAGITRQDTDVFNMLNADAVIVGEVAEFCTFKQIVNVQGVCSYNLKLVDIKTGEVIFTFSVNETAAMSSHMTALDTAMVKFSKAISEFELPQNISPGS